MGWNMYEHAKDSLGRCLNHGGFLNRFYEILIQQHSDVAEKFQDVDMARQEAALKNGINLAIMFAEDNPIGVNAIQRIRDSHCRDNLDIKPALYEVWLDSFIEALSEIDPHYGSVAEEEWREILQKTIAYIIDGYDCQSSRAS